MSQPPPMPVTPLPYATPAAYGAPAGGLWRSGNTLVTGREMTLPPECIRCGEPGSQSYTKTVYWHHPLYFLLILPGLLIYAIVALCVRKKATYTCMLCALHAKKRRNAVLVIWLSVLLMIGAFALAIAGGNDAFGRANEGVTVAVGVLGGFALLLFLLIYSLVALPLLKPKKIDDHYAYYTGAGTAFLAPLSEVG